VHISAKSDYALRVLVHLAELFQGEMTEPISIRILAEKNDVPRRFLEQIMIELRACGWVKSVAGRDGGFILAKSPEQITMGDVVRHFEGSLAPIACVSMRNYVPCSQEPVCRFRRVLLEIRNYAAFRLDEATLQSLLHQSPVQLTEINRATYRNGAGI
jgi:Rrf2 family protein